MYADRLQRAHRAGSAQVQSEDRSLAGTFVSLIRQQHAQRACLLERGAQHLWKETDQMADCARCKKLSYITVAINNTLAAVSSFALHNALLSVTFSGSRCISDLQGSSPTLASSRGLEHPIKTQTAHNAGGWVDLSAHVSCVHIEQYSA